MSGGYRVRILTTLPAIEWRRVGRPCNRWRNRFEITSDADCPFGLYRKGDVVTCAVVYPTAEIAEAYALKEIASYEQRYGFSAFKWLEAFPDGF